MLSLLRPTENLADLSRLMAESEEERARQEAIVRAREYHSGRQFVRLTTRLREFLQDRPGGSDSDYLRLNISRTVVTAVVERLRVRQIASPDERLAAFAQQVWTRSGGATMADDAHEYAVRDGEAFVLVDWDAAAALPRLVVHPRFVDAAMLDPLGTSFGDDTADRARGDYWSPGRAWSGQGFGCVAHYPDDDMGRPPSHVVKRWADDGPDGRRRQRITVYYPDRVEKYALTPRREPVLDDGDPGWPLRLAHQGQPLGLLAVPLYNPGAACEAWEALPLQNAINKQLIDLLAAGDMTAFRILFAAGWLPTTDGKAPSGTNGLPVNPGQWVGSTNADAKLQSVDGANLENLMAPIERLIQWAAMVTDTPVARFTVSRQVAAADTLKAQEGPLVAKVEKRQALMGQAWAEALRVAARLCAVYNPVALMGADPDAEITVDWHPAATRDPVAELEALRIKGEALGVPRAQLWREAGYTEDEIATMLADQAAEDRRRAALAIPQPPTTPTPGGNTAGENDDDE